MDFESWFGRGVRYPDEVRAWIRDMASDSPGRHILHNIFEREKKFGNLTREVLWEFFDDLGKLRQARPTTAPRDAIEEVADARPGFFCVAGIAGPSRDQRCSRIMSIHEMRTYLGARLHYPPDFDRHLDQQFADKIRRGLIASCELSGPIKGGRSFGWVTSSEEVDRTVQSVGPADAPSALRNGLGLAAYDEGDCLVEVVFPAPFPPLIRFAAPTFLDGGRNAHFRSVQATAGWGRAVDLVTLDDGMPEAVHDSCEINSSYRIRVVGTIDRPCPEPDYDDLLRHSKAMM